MACEWQVAVLKQRIAHRLNIPPRKALELTWWGTKLEDDKSLGHYKLTDAGSGTVELRLRSRVQAELEQLRDVRSVRVCCNLEPSMTTVISDLSIAHTVRQIKRALLDRKAFPGLDAKSPETAISLYYSPVFQPMPVFGNPMEDDRTLGSYAVLDEDFIYCKLPPPPTDPKEKAPAKKK